MLGLLRHLITYPLSRLLSIYLSIISLCRLSALSSQLPALTDAIYSARHGYASM